MNEEIKVDVNIESAKENLSELQAAFKSMNEGVLSSERSFLDEKKRLLTEEERLEDEKHLREYNKKLSNAKTIEDIEAIKQNEILRQKKNADREYLNRLEETYKAEREALCQLKSDIKSIYDDISSYANEQIDEVLAAQQRLEGKMKNFGDLYSETKNVYKNLGGGAVLKDGILYNEKNFTVERQTLGNIKEDIKTLTDYKDALFAVKERMSEITDFSSVKDFFSVMADMSVEDGLKFANLLNSSSDGEFKNYISLWVQKQGLSEQLSSELYSDEFREAVDNSADYMKSQLEKAGLEVPEGFLASGAISAQNFGKAFAEELDKQMDEIRQKIQSFNLSLASEYGSGTPVSAYTTNNSTTYVLSGSGETVSDQLQSARAYSEVERMRNS